MLLDHIYQGDCREVLAGLPEASVDLVFADPPYNLQLSQELRRPNQSIVNAVEDNWDQFESFAAYDNFTREWLQACRRVLKDTGTLWTMGSYHNVYRIGSILQEMGFWLLNDVVWVKCLSGTTRVYVKTQRGERPMAIHDLFEIPPGQAQLWNGSRWTSVCAVTSSLADAGLEITLRSGEHLRCTKNHIWPTARGDVLAADLEVGDVLKSCQLPEPQCDLYHQGLDDELVGWFVGLYLAEGSRYADTLQIAGHVGEELRLQRLENLAIAYDGSITVQRKVGKSCTANLNGRILNAIIDTYVAGTSAKDKHLTLKCWGRSNAFLRSVLLGYLEGDGHYYADNDLWGLGFTINNRLESDLRALAARLGASLRLKTRTIRSNTHTITSLNGREFEQYYGTLRFRQSSHRSNKADTEIIAINPIGRQQFFDIAVADEPHLFALASGVLTHNSNPMPQFRGVRLANAHETLIWARKSRDQRRYTFNYHALKHLNDGKQMRSDWHLPICSGAERLRVDGAKLHSTQKPEALLYRVILASSNPGDIVLDPFFGTGTTGAVARRLGRRFIGVEREAAYVEAARARIAAIPAPTADPEALGRIPTRRSAPRLPFAALLERGLIRPGQVLFYRGRRDSAATVLADGTLRAADGARGSIHQVGAHVGNLPACNGWEHWHYEDETGQLAPLDVLRERVRREGLP